LQVEIQLTPAGRLQARHPGGHIHEIECDSLAAAGWISCPRSTAIKHLCAGDSALTIRDKRAACTSCGHLSYTLPQAVIELLKG